MNLSTVPIEIGDRINARILAVSEDRIQGFQRHRLGEIARQSSVELPVVIERIQAMLRSGTIRRVRQTLLATNLAQGALVDWQVFFFSSRRRHTRLQGDWSSDVCSSD